MELARGGELFDYVSYLIIPLPAATKVILVFVDGKFS
jgi:hypothetical protein